jgi:hypothetical protein
MAKAASALASALTDDTLNLQLAAYVNVLMVQA